jgi:hypothetical protein
LGTLFVIGLAVIQLTRVNARLSILRSPNMQAGGAAELDLRPFEVSDLAGAQAVAVGDEDERRVTMPIAAAAGGADQVLDLGRREILAGALRDVGGPQRAYCPINVALRLAAQPYKH